MLLQCIIITALLLRTSPELRESEAELKGKKVETGEDINGLYKTRMRSEQNRQ